jgi:hypothetical protein
MTFDKFKDLFENIIKSKEESDRFICSIPSSIYSAFIDNDHVDSLYRHVNYLRNYIFGAELNDDIDYFLYEDVGEWYIKREEREYKIHDFDEALDYFEKEYKWD